MQPKSIFECRAQLLLTDLTFGSGLSSCCWLKEEKVISCGTYQVHAMKVQGEKRTENECLLVGWRNGTRTPGLPTMSCNSFRHKLHLLLLIMPVIDSLEAKAKSAYNLDGDITLQFD